MKPSDTAAPGSNVELYEGVVTVTVAPDWLKVPFEPLEMVVPAGSGA